MPHQIETDSVPHQPETDSVPHQTETDSVPHQPETDSIPNSEPVHVKDVGKHLTSKTNLRTLTAPEKLGIIDNHFKPGEDYEFPRTDINKCNTAFRHQWLATYPWLVYSKEVDGGFCLPCVLFATKEKLGVLVNTLFRGWTKVSDICRQHQ